MFRQPNKSPENPKNPYKRLKYESSDEDGTRRFGEDKPRQYNNNYYLPSEHHEHKRRGRTLHREPRRAPVLAPAIAQPLQYLQRKTLELQKSVDLQQKIVEKQDKEIVQLKQQVESLQKQRMQETLSARLKKFILAGESPEAFTKATSLFEFEAPENYSQAVLLRKINLYLESAKKEKISEKGYCHGIVLLWLLMMSWGVEALFYQLIKVIADCPPEQLHKIKNTIMIFLDLIDLGQNPEKHSNKACTQQNVDEIIGDVGQLLSVTQKYTKSEMENAIGFWAYGKSMIAVTRWWNDEETKKEKGHTTGIIFRDSTFHFFDPNYKKLAAPTFESKEAVVKELWERVFTNVNSKVEDHSKFSLNVVYSKQTPSVCDSYKQMLFGGSVKQQSPQHSGLGQKVSSSPGGRV